MDYLYVCHFSNGHIKVGRSIDPTSRIAQHADRVGCMGLELVEHHIVECIGHSKPAEAALISACSALAPKCNKSEWFEGLDYVDVCAIAERCALDPSLSIVEMSADAVLIMELGGPAKVARLLGYETGGVQRVFNWVKRDNIPSDVKLKFPEIFIYPFAPGRKAKTTSKAVA